MIRHSIPGLLLIPIFVCMIIGWTPSLHPIYTDKDIIFDPALCGTWMAKADEFSMNFAPSDKYKDAYILTFTDSEGKPGSMLMHLVKLEDHRFLDLYPPETKGPDFQNTLTLDIHAFMLVVQIEPELIIRDLSGEWLNQYLEDHPDSTMCDSIESEYMDCSTRVFRASTEEMQKFMVEHIDTEGAYGEPIVFSRVAE